ncbi:hypothetical protein DCE93_00060 [Agromyces badenianii]|uniref:Uncharacterized protein n=1 Tax=Agromyces badenianii TaxID=2080742 RepID=A0A2S0WSE1_9MICO|nr:hypothetical protein [Agromyces badenianii]AWB94265.1 hypothetical protein DCE93_00060 [Agromyces badenianii]
MNTSTLTAGRSPQGQAVALRADARLLRERIARRTGLALIAWGRRQDERRTHSANSERRRNELLAARLQAAEFQRMALIATPMI